MVFSYNKRKAKSLVFILLMVSIFMVAAETSVSAQLPQEEDLDRYIERYQRVMNIPALAVAVMHQGETLYSRGWGDEVDGDTMFYIGSISKSFTGLAVMQLVEQGEIDLDSPVSAYIPEFTVSDEIEVQHLLHHVSGMTEFDFMSELQPDASAEELVEYLNRMTPSHPPGEVFAYFNPNYSLLGLIVERISGQTYGEYLEEHIFAPLQLQHISTQGEADVPGHQSFFGFSIEREETFVRYDLPAGFITASARDMLTYLEAIRTRDPVLGLSEEGFLALQSENDFGTYGMGWINGSYEDLPAVFHGGSLPGYLSEAVMLTEDEYSIVILANKNHLVNAIFLFPDLAHGIVTILKDEVPTDRLTLFWVYRAFGILFVISVLGNVVKTLKLLFFAKPMSRFRRIFSVVINLMIPVVIYFMVPIVSKTVLQRGFTWELGLQLVPDFLSWLIIGMGFHVLEGLAHLIHYSRGIDR